MTDDNKKQYRVGVIERTKQDGADAYRICFFRDKHFPGYDERELNENLVLPTDKAGQFLKKIHTRLSDSSRQHEWMKGDPDDTLAGTPNDNLYKYHPAFKGTLDWNNDLDLDSVEPDEEYTKRQDKAYGVTDDQKKASDYVLGNYTKIVKANDKLPAPLYHQLWDNWAQSGFTINPDKYIKDNQRITKNYQAQTKGPAKIDPPSSSFKNMLSQAVEQSQGQHKAKFKQTSLDLDK